MLQLTHQKRQSERRKKIGLWHWQLDTRNEVTNANKALEENLSSLSNLDGVESTFSVSGFTGKGWSFNTERDTERCSANLGVLPYM